MFLSFIRYLFLALNHSRRLLSGSLCHVIISHLPQHLPHRCFPSDLYLINHRAPAVLTQIIAPGCYVQCCTRILPPHCTAPPSPWQSPALRPPASDEKMRKSIKSPLATVCRAECIQIFTGQRVGNTSRKKTFLNDINPVHKEKHQHIIPTSSKTLFIEDRVCESTFHESLHHVSMCRCSRMTRHDQAVSQQTNVRTGRSAAFQ